jgi:hypothetical protein
MLWCLWGIKCNRKTRAQRDFISDYLVSNPKLWKLTFKDESVEYQAHMKALMRFRNVRKLYPPEVWHVFDIMPNDIR